MPWAVPAGQLGRRLPDLTSPRIQQIVGLDEQNQILTTNIWLNMKWWDPFMQWNSTEHNNIQVDT